MIYLEMYGRLGNQLFRYAVARSIQLKYYQNEKICINFQQINDFNKKDQTFYNALADYSIENFETYRKTGKVIFNESNLIQKLICIPYYLKLKHFKAEEMKEQLLYQKKWCKILDRVGVYWFRIGFCKISESKFKNKFLSGSFESPEYFADIRETLLKEFTPKHGIISKNIKLYDLIYKTNSVCISIRRGDFETDEKISKLHSVCNENYFIKAIELIKEKVENPTFFMFSDDIEWVKNNIKTGCITFYEDGTDPVWEKLRLMSSCKHFVISNSTFSWWSQWLSTNENKIVISPNRWFNNDYNSPLIDKEKWIIIDC